MSSYEIIILLMLADTLSKLPFDCDSFSVDAINGLSEKGLIKIDYNCKSHWRVTEPGYHYCKKLFSVCPDE